MAMRFTHSVAFYLMLLFAESTVGQQLLYEPFNYSPSATNGLAAQSNNRWTPFNTGDSIFVVSGNLPTTPIAGFPASTGNRIVFGDAGTDYARTFPSQSVGIVYYSLILRVVAIGGLNTTGGYIVGIGSSNTTLGATLWLRRAGAGYNIGISKRTATADVIWGTTEVTLNADVLVVAAYTFNGTSDDVARLWINPTSFGGAEPATTLITTTTGTDLSSIGRLILRQDSNTETPDSLSIDEIRVGTSWASVTTNPPPIPTRLAVTGVSPASPIAGQPFSVTVQSADGGGTARAVSQNTTVQLSASAGALGGTTSDVIASGKSQVVISNVTYSSPATITLTASAVSGDVLASGTSNSITVQPAPFTPFYEPFNGTGNLTGANGWQTHSGIAGQLQRSATPSDVGTSLAYNGLVAPTGNRVSLSAGGSEDVNLGFGTTSSGTIYYAALVKVRDSLSLTSNAGGGDYFLHLGSQSGGSIGTQSVRLFVRRGSESGSVNFGILNASGAATFGDVSYAIGQTHLVVVKYDFGARATSLWVNPPIASLGSAEPSAQLTNNAGSAASSFSGFAIRQGTNTGNLDIDELRVGASWASVTPPTSGATQLAFNGLPTTFNSNQTLPAFTVEARRINGTVDNTFGGTVVLEKISGIGTLQGTLTRIAASGVATFNDVQFSRDGIYTLRARSGVLSPVASAPIIVGNPQPPTLRFANFPANAIVSQPLSAFTVEARLPNGALDTNFANPVSLQPSSGTLRGTRTQTARRGAATFSDIAFSDTGSYTITASSAGVADVISPTLFVSTLPARVAFVSAPTSAFANTPFPRIIVEARRADGSVDSLFAGTITLSRLGGRVALLGTLSRNTVRGAATFADLSVVTPDTFRLVASSPGVQSDTSAQIIVSTAPTTRLQITGVVTVGRVNDPLPAFAVEAMRMSGGIDTTSNAPVTISALNAPNALSGNLTRSLVRGVARFDSIRLTAAAVGTFIRLLATTANALSDTSGIVFVATSNVQRDNAAGVPTAFALDQNYPNPFNPSTVISYQLPINSAVKLAVYDLLGREVQTLVNTRQAAGRYSTMFTAASLPSGVYFYRLQAGTFMQTKKMLLLK